MAGTKFEKGINVRIIRGPPKPKTKHPTQTKKNTTKNKQRTTKNQPRGRIISALSSQAVPMGEEKNNYCATALHLFPTILLRGGLRLRKVWLLSPSSQAIIHSP